jgi:hypothetical protein
MLKYFFVLFELFGGRSTRTGRTMLRLIREIGVVSVKQHTRGI